MTKAKKTPTPTPAPTPDTCPIATFKKLKNGAWGVLTRGFIPNDGDTIVVTKRNGDRTDVTVRTVVWKDDADKAAIATLVPKFPTNQAPY